MRQGDTAGKIETEGEMREIEGKRRENEGE